MAFGPEHGDRLILQIGQLLVRRNHAAQPRIGEEENERQADEHHQALQSVGVHHALQPPHDDIYRHDDGEGEQRRFVMHAADAHFDETRRAHQHHGGVQRHEQQNHQRGEGLQTFRLKAPAQEFGKGVGVEPPPHRARALAEKQEGDEDADKNIKKNQPEDAQAEHGGHAAEADNGRCRNECGAIRECHDHGIHLATTYQIVGSGIGLAVAQPAQIGQRKKINQNNQAEGECIHALPSLSLWSSLFQYFSPYQAEKIKHAAPIA
ncbi:MAG: hypothetical protein BWY83_03334 [bacterium ADurb.Bin478]|nr:MAG: hypothetical protein BWY83_03334 [bacterium ADurb.Bin478]